MVKPREDAKASQLNVSVMILPPLRTSRGPFVVLPNYMDQLSSPRLKQKEPQGGSRLDLFQDRGKCVAVL